MSINVNAHVVDMDAKSQATFDTVMSFMGAMGNGDMDAVVICPTDRCGTDPCANVYSSKITSSFYSIFA